MIHPNTYTPTYTSITNFTYPINYTISTTSPQLVSTTT
jgi:hypothetical protein